MPELTILLTIFASSFVIAFSGALMPGPLLTAAISESSQRGFIVGPLMIAGHAVLELALVIALLTGLAPFLQLPAVFVATALSGAIILFWMAWGMIRSLPSLHLSWDADQKQRRNPVLSGILMSVVNPYWTIWWATIGLVWYSIVTAAVAGGRRFLTDRLYRGLIAVCAAFLVVFAGYFAYAGLTKLAAIAA